jgi:hypothetical protein
MTAPTLNPTLNRLNNQVLFGNAQTAGAAAEALAQLTSGIDPDFTFTVYDNLWNNIGDLSGDVMEASGTDPWNSLPAATIKYKGGSAQIPNMMNCSQTMVGVTVETEGLRYPFYVDTHDYEFTDKGEWSGTAHCLGIWDILNYLQIWPDWLLPIQAQVLSHAIFLGPLCTVIETFISECALRIQSGINQFINNFLSGNPSVPADIPVWFMDLIEGNGNILELLKTPVYVVRHNPFLDTSPLVCRTVRMESCGAVIKDITRSYGVDVQVNLWMPGDAQPDIWTQTVPWMTLTQPTYVVTVNDRSQITGPTGTVIDSVIRTVVDIEGSVAGNDYAPLLNPQGEYVPDGMFIAPTLGVNFVAPWVVIIAPEPGMPGSVSTCKITDHTPKGWQHIIGGRSPQWLNDLMNSTFSWIIDSISILIGVTGIPSDLLSGFLNDAFLAFQLLENFNRRQAVGPYHPAIEVFHATSTAPYNIETEFAFINSFWDARGWTCAQATFRNGVVYSLGKDLFRGALVSIVYLGRTKMVTDYVMNTMWRINPTTRDVFVQVGDGKALESPLAKQQRLVTGALEAINVLTLAPQSSSS